MASSRAMDAQNPMESAAWAAYGDGLVKILPEAKQTIAASERNRAISCFFVLMQRDIPSPHKTQGMKFDPASGRQKLMANRRFTKFDSYEAYEAAVDAWGLGDKQGRIETVMRNAAEYWSPLFDNAEEAAQFYFGGGSKATESLSPKALTLFYMLASRIEKGESIEDKALKPTVVSDEPGYITPPSRQPMNVESIKVSEVFPVPQRGAKDWEDLPQSQVKAPDDISLGDVLGKIAQDNSEDK